MTIEVHNAQITAAEILIEDHDILTSSLTLTFENWAQSYGGRAMCSGLKTELKWLEEKNTRIIIGHAFSLLYLRGVMEVIGVRKWNDLVGRYCRVQCVGHRILQIGHITQPRWFSDEALLAMVDTAAWKEEK